MKLVLLVGVAQNWFGAAMMLLEVWRRARSDTDPPDYEQLKMFAAGTAATFGAFYLYLFINPRYVIPFLVFGAALKTWAFILSAILRVRGRLAREPFLVFGGSNLLVATLFWIYVVVTAT